MEIEQHDAPADESAPFTNRLAQATDAETGVVQEDALFFGVFRVPVEDWEIYRRIENMGYMYLHRVTRRPIFVYRLLSNDDEAKLSGFAITFQRNDPPSPTIEAVTRLVGAEQSMPANLAVVHDIFARLGPFLSLDVARQCVESFCRDNEFAEGELSEPRRQVKVPKSRRGRK